MLKKILKTKKEWVQSMRRYQGKEEVGVLEMCRKCYSFRYDNGWHFERPDYLLEKDVNEQISVRFRQCPACVEEALAMYDMEYV